MLLLLLLLWCVSSSVVCSPDVVQPPEVNPLVRVHVVSAVAAAVVVAAVAAIAVVCPGVAAVAGSGVLVSIELEPLYGLEGLANVRFRPGRGIMESEKDKKNPFSFFLGFSFCARSAFCAGERRKETGSCDTEANAAAVQVQEK